MCEKRSGDPVLIGEIIVDSSVACAGCKMFEQCIELSALLARVKLAYVEKLAFEKDAAKGARLN